MGTLFPIAFSNPSPASYTLIHSVKPSTHSFFETLNHYARPQSFGPPAALCGGRQAQAMRLHVMDTAVGLDSQPGPHPLGLQSSSHGGPLSEPIRQGHWTLCGGWGLEDQ